MTTVARELTPDEQRRVDESVMAFTAKLEEEFPHIPAEATVERFRELVTIDILDMSDISAEKINAAAEVHLMGLLEFSGTPEDEWDMSAVDALRGQLRLLWQEIFSEWRIDVNHDEARRHTVRNTLHLCFSKTAVIDDSNRYCVTETLGNLRQMGVSDEMIREHIQPNVRKALFDRLGRIRKQDLEKRST